MRNSVLIITLIISFASFGQNETSCADEILYQKAKTIIESTYDDEFYMWANHNENKVEEEHIKKIFKKINLEALNYYTQLTEEYPTSDRYYESLYQKGNLEWILNNYESAKQTLSKVVNFKIERGGYNKNRALISLASIAIEEKEYAQGLKYLDASKEYKLDYRCGNAYESDKTRLENMYRECNEGLSNKKK